ncbi:hypothetical protein [Carboxylicivirga sp. N1Y90]|uniref:hypothetical protein n=1 Tax=Carboxylicivirga fragile TaxID=3417571 RepID=UPI003D334029|nr:hypothetical protein [Marinilabiliaceae bacterium N1Y90]
MLEIIVIIFLSKRIGKIVRPKGHKVSKYIVTMILLWLSLEFLIVAIAFKVTGDLMSAMPFGLIGAAIGGYLGHKLAVDAVDLTLEKS